MITAAEQYRALVAKLEAINPSQPPAPLAVPVELEKPVSEGGYAPATPQAPEDPTQVAQDAAATDPAQSAMNVASGNIPQASGIPQSATPAIASNEIPALPGTFKQAYAQAVKQGLKQFKWCGTYSTRRGQAPNPAPTSNVQPRLLGQGPGDAVLKDKYGRPLPKANQDLIRQSYDDSTSAGGAAG